MREPWEEGGMRNDELEAGSGGSGARRGFSTAPTCCLHWWKQVRLSVWARSRAACLCRSWGERAHRGLCARCSQVSIPGPLWAVQAPGPSEPSSHHQESSWLKPRASCPRQGCPDASVGHPALTGMVHTEPSSLLSHLPPGRPAAPAFTEHPEGQPCARRTPSIHNRSSKCFWKDLSSSRCGLLAQTAPPHRGTRGVAVCLTLFLMQLRWCTFHRVMACSSSCRR